MGPNGQSARAYLERTIRNMVRRTGFDVHRHHPQRRRMTLGEAFEHVASAFPSPRTVIDVGVAAGTPELYSAFPDATLLLVEPLAEWEPHLAALQQARPCHYELAAASAEDGTVKLHVPDQLSHSSFYTKDGSGLDHGWTARTIPTRRLDDIVGERALPGPYVVKVDVEGAELEVLRGAGTVLQDTVAVALEVTLLDVFDGGATFAEIVGMMDAAGFDAYDFVGGFCRAGDLALYQLDVMFVARRSKRDRSGRQ